MNLFDLFESNRKDVDEGHTVVPSINRERYTDLSHEGLEGPIRLKSGKVVYYDPKVGQYYDRDSDIYMSHEEHAAHELEEKSNKLGFKLSPTLVNRRQAHALTTGFKKNKFNFEEYENESLDDEFAKFKSNKSSIGRAQNPFASAAPAREMPRKPQISPAEMEQRTGQLNRCKQLLDVVNAGANPDPALSRIGNYIDKIDVNHFSPGELDNIEKYLSNYVAGAVAKKSRKASKSGKVSRIDPADVMAENQPLKRIGPDMTNPYEQGWYAHWNDANPYQKGTPDYDSWAKGQDEKEAQRDHYLESIEEGATQDKINDDNKKNKRIYYNRDNFIKNIDPRLSEIAVDHENASSDGQYNESDEGYWAGMLRSQEFAFEMRAEEYGIDPNLFYNAIRTNKISEGGRLDMSSPEEKAARKAYIKANGHPPPLTPTSVVAKYNPENDKKMRDYYLRRKGVPQDKLDKMKEDGVAEGSEKKTMSRAAKGNEKYGKDGMKALAKAGREGKDLDKVRNKYNKYDESIEEGAKVDRMVQHIKSSEKKTGKSSKDAENIAWATANKRGMLDNKNKKKNVKEGDMASAAHHPSGAKFGGYYKGTQKGAPRPGQGFGSMEESISLNTTVKAIANDIGEPITSLYATLKKMAKQYYDNNGDLKRFGLVAAGVGSRWFQQYYVNKMQTDLYDLTRQSPTHAAELKQFLRGKMIKDNLVMPKSFSDLTKDLPEILVRMGSKMGAESLAKNAKAWVHNKQDYEDFINKLVNGKGDDDDQDTPATVDAPSKDALLGKQRNHAEEIVNDVLLKLPSSVAGDIRKAIARAPNKLQALQQELQRRKIVPPIEEGLKQKVAGAVLAGAAALGAGGAQAQTTDKYDPDWNSHSMTHHIRSDVSSTKSMNSADPSKNTHDFQKRIQNVTGPNAKGEYKVVVMQGNDIVSHYVTKTPPPNWLYKEDEESKTNEGIAGNMKVRSDPLTNLKQVTDLKMKKPDPFKGMANHNNLSSAKARNLVAKGAQTAGPGTGSHKNKALDVKKGLTRNIKHKGKIDFSESANFLTWAVSAGYNVITNPAVYENAKQVYNRLLIESKDDLKPGQYYIWTVHFDNGDSSRIKIKDEKFDVKAYYKKQNKSVISVDYNWEPQGN